MARDLRPKRNAAVPDLKQALKDIQAFLDGERSDKVPEGFMHIEEIGKQWGKARTHTRRMLAAAERMGTVEKIQLKSGRVKRLFYRFKARP